MRSLRTWTILLGAICLSLGATAQPFSGAFAAAEERSTPATTKVVSSKKNKEAADFYRHHKQLPSNYSGYVIELITTQLPLPRNHELFEQFGSVYYKKLRKGGYAYCIMVNFSRKKSIEQFVKNVVALRAPEAKVVTYKKGKRKRR